MRKTVARLLLATGILAGCTLLARAEDKVTPATEQQLEERVTALQKEAKQASCNPQERLCALARLTLANSAVELARAYTHSDQCSGQQACLEWKDARLTATKAFAQTIKEEFKGGFLDVHDVPEETPALMAYASKVQDDLKANPCKPEERLCLIGTLAALVEADQALRHGYTLCNRLSPEARNECSKPIAPRIWEADQQSVKTLSAITAKTGWPDAVHWGITTGSHAWLLAQHADKDKETQSAFLALMKVAFDQGLVVAKDYAYLIDRQAVGQNKPQIYGTQGTCTGYGPGAKAEAKAIEDPDHVDDRRRQIGLPPLQKYLDGLSRHCAGGH